MAEKQNPEKTFAFLIDNGRPSEQRRNSYEEVDNVDELEIHDLICSVFMDVYVFKDEFIGSTIQKEIEKDMDGDKSYSVLVLNVESNLDLETINDLLFEILSDDEATLGTYEFEVAVTGAYAFISNSR